MPTKKPRMYLRRTAMGKADFLLRCLQIRDSQEFAEQFAQWLADSEACRIPVVRQCFDKEPDEQQRVRLLKSTPAELFKLTGAIQAESDSTERRRLIKARNRLMPEKAREKLAAKLTAEDALYRADYTNRRRNILAKLHPYEQVAQLNRWAVELKLFALEGPVNPKAEREAGQRYLTTLSPRMLTHAEVQEAFYASDPGLRWLWVAETKLHWEAIGGKTIDAYARGRPPGVADSLRQIALALRFQTRPSGESAEPKGRGAQSLLEGTLIPFLQKHEEFANKLPALTSQLILAHLKLVRPALLQDAATGQSKPAFQRKPLRVLAETAREEIRAAAESLDRPDGTGRPNRGTTNPPPTAKELTAELQKVYRRVRRLDALVDVLAWFLLCEVSPSDVSRNPRLYGRLEREFKNDAVLIGNFLFATGAANHTQGLLHAWMTMDADGSIHRLKRAEVRFIDGVRAMERERKSKREILKAIEGKVGVPEPEDSLLKARLDSREMRLRRLRGLRANRSSGPGD